MTQLEDIIIFCIRDKFIVWNEVRHVSQERNFKKHKPGDNLWRSLYINIDCRLIEYSDGFKLKGKPLSLCPPNDGLWVVRRKPCHNQGCLLVPMLNIVLHCRSKDDLFKRLGQRGFNSRVGEDFWFQNLYRTGYRVTYFLSNVLRGLLREGWCGWSWS
jgi:hypothetical protein